MRHARTPVGTGPACRSPLLGRRRSPGGSCCSSTASSYPILSSISRRAVEERGAARARTVKNSDRTVLRVGEGSVAAFKKEANSCKFRT